MEEHQQVLEYKCPCCDAGLKYREGSLKLRCEYCDNEFDLDTVRAFNDGKNKGTVEEVSWKETETKQWSDKEQDAMRSFQCPSCGGEILTDEMTAASFCPYCDNPTVLPSRLSGSIRPDALIPFQKTREDAKTAFLRLCKGKPLLPKGFTQEQRLEHITGVYVPFWLYDCDGEYDGNYKATRVQHWSDSSYNYTKTDHYLLQRSAEASFCGIPMDGSSKADDTFMESIEPYDYSQLRDFDMAYLTGYLADKYDVPSEKGEDRIRQRVDQTFQDRLFSDLNKYHSVVTTSRQLRVHNSTAKYVLLPVWMLNTNYRGKVYSFMMNGQTGKITGTLPTCPKRAAAWFAGISAAVAVLTTAARMALPLFALLTR